MSERFDLVVIGGGPAGSAAAITAARKGHRVALLERGSFPRHKVCGEFVSAESLTMLNNLLDSSHVLEAQHPRISSARIFIDGKVRSLRINPSAASIPRFEMDAALWQAAKYAGVVAIETAIVRDISGDGPFRVSAADADYVSRAVINASGRWSNVGGAMKPSLDAKLGVKAHFREPTPTASVDLYFFEGGYCGVQPIGGDTINVSAMVSPATAKTLDNVFRLNSALLERSRSWSAITEQVSTYPLIFHGPSPIDVERNILNAGDAAAFIDPFVGDGISMALHSGTLAADSVSAFLKGECTLWEAALSYRQDYDAGLLPAFRNAAKIRKLIDSPAFRTIAMQLIKIPALSRLAIRSTRARSA
jgi:flavin-dependent dehydrogenase